MKPVIKVKKVVVQKDTSKCPKCNTPTNTFRHIGAKIWCSNPTCGFILREEGAHELTF